MARDINFNQILQDEASFQIVRTNPKLTGNVKVTINDSDKMWLNSINANEELSKSLYKRVAIDTNVSLPANMYKFFSSGDTPPEIVFDLSESFDTTKTSADYKDQYDFSHYFSGVKYLPSRRYTEQLSYFAPIFLKKEVPDYFIIFKIKDPINDNISTLESKYPFNKEEYLKEMFKKASVIKTFNIKKSTSVGKYIRDYINDDSFPNSPLDVSYEEDRLTNWNGIMYDSGVFGSRGEDLYDLYKSSNPLKFFEEYISLGYERNGIIFPNILNLEFIFNDDSSELYDFNRYFGVYVNAIELEKLDIDIDRAYEERGIWPNTPSLKRKYSESESVNIIQENQNGVVIPVMNSGVYFSDFENIFETKKTLFINYLLDRFGNIHTPKLDSPYDIDFEGATELNSGKITMSDSKMDIGDFFGPSTPFLQDIGNSTEIRGYSHAYIEIKTTNYLDGIKIYHPHGSRFDSNGRYELIEGATGYNLVPNPGDYYAYNDIDNVVGHNIYYYNIDGREEEVTSAIASCINEINNASFKAEVIDTTIVIKSNSPGDYDSYYSIEFVSSSSSYDSVVINDITGIDLQNNPISFEGGSRPAGNRLIIDSGHYQKINDNIDDILVKTKNGWSKIKKVSKYIDAISEKNLTTKEDKRISLTRFLDNLAICLIEEDTPYTSSGEFTMVLKHRPSFGLLSFFPIKDFDFDFYSSEYLNFPKIDLYQSYFTPEKLKSLRTNTSYSLYGVGVIRLENGIEIEVNGQASLDTTLQGLITYGGNYPPLPSPFEYTVISGDVIVDADGESIGVGENRWRPAYDENEELQSFEGFFLIKDPDKVIPESEEGIYKLRNKYLNGIANSEYEFYKENSSKDFSLKSKIIPYISKWVSPDGLDSRSNPYRLNSELVFGYNNFSPDHEDRSQNPSNFTHEWYYIESNFNYSDSKDIVKLNNSYFPEPFELNRALTETGYFIDYFTYTPSFAGEEVARTQTRYTPIKKNNLGVYETFFKGFKIQFKDYIDSNNLNEAGKPEFNDRSNKFDGYKFTCLVKPIKENINDDSVPPIRYRFIEHSDFKFIMLIIEVSIGSRSEIDNIWRNGASNLLTSDYKTISGDPTDPSSNNLNTLDTAAVPGTPAYDTINGDYRILFDNIGGHDVSNLSHTLLYSLKHKKFNMLEDNFSNIRLSTKLHLKNPSFSGTNVDIAVPLENQNIPNYPSSLKDEIHEVNKNTFLVANDSLLNEDRLIDEFVGINNQFNNTMVSITNQGIKYSDQGPLNMLSSLSGLQYQPIPATSLGQGYIQNYYTFKIVSGGKLYYETLFEKLSFGEFKEIVNSQDEFIEYESYSYDGSLSNIDANWYSEIPNPSSITKTDAIVTMVDENIPSNLSSSEIVGFTYERSKLDNTYDLNRYEGGFEPLFKDLFFFNSKFNFNNNDISPLDLSNTRLNINVDGFMTILNFSHVKIANTKILDLESNEEYDPKYEKVDEIAIGRSDYDLFSSNWDWGFHHKYTNKSENVPVSGTLRLEEDDSFIGKILKLRNVIELESYIEEKVNDIDNINISNQEIAYEIENDKIVGIINVENALTSYLLADGIASKFSQFLDTDPKYIGNFSQIEDYVKEYIKLNIIKLYEIEEVEFYTKEDRSLLGSSGLINNNAIEFRFLDDANRVEQGYKLNRNLQINKIDRFTLKFEFNKSLNSGFLVSPKIKIKFI